MTEVNCREIERTQVIERYLNEKLSPREAEAFEEHYFECDACFAELKLRDSLAREFRSDGLESGSPDRSESSFLSWKWGLAAAALLLILILPLTLLMKEESIEAPPSQQASLSSPELPEALVTIEEMPPYLPTTVRGAVAGSGQELFREGMAIYSEGDYTAAVPVLEKAANERPDHIPTSFYLGVIYLSIGLTGEAVEQLTKVAASGNELYQEEALWYLAKAHFRLRDIAEGRTRLEQVAAMDGLFAEDARRNLELLEKVRLRE